MSGLKTSYEFTLPRGYVDDNGQLHRTGTMRLATARDELAPLRDPTVSGPDDPRLTILVLTRVVEKLGDIEMITAFEIEGLFAVDLAFLQDFYGVINFGSQEEYDALLAAQQSSPLLGSTGAVSGSTSTAPEPEAPTAAVQAAEPTRPALRTAVEELPRRAQ
jgi:hypothetical protein